MKKRVLIVLVIAILAIGVIFAVYKSVSDSPKYALLQTVSDIKEKGVEGLPPHLTKSARAKIEPLLELANNKAVGTIASFFAAYNQNVQLIIEHIKEINWDIGKSSISGTNAVAIVTFAYGDNFSGSIEVKMKREESQWKIDDLSITEVTLSKS
ncbi:hypothetical protein I5Q82_03150 [Acutalibacter muris]|uniref:DUF4878 domain-containing protein n=1 Tax=Acutalibacter muris TaxID=1796620 RepID=A0A1Z2XSL9_9FIRM|nr:hypothetical protein [Acutalibacter muris]ANU55308.1 hypothetical protein A4V00_15510 [Hungateiclostridiaceae bacterium KB18]ASB41456.1 hypothetical protein ADH66_12830 [Acutalibacter muris]QQR30714.1 hypothetical protein I5Q82_03150 [Acutalibacter muris]